MEKDVVIIVAWDEGKTSSLVSKCILKTREAGLNVVEYKRSTDIETNVLVDSENSEILNLAIQLNELSETENRIMREVGSKLIELTPDDNSKYFTK